MAAIQRCMTIFEIYFLLNPCRNNFFFQAMKFELKRQPKRKTKLLGEKNQAVQGAALISAHIMPTNSFLYGCMLAVWSWMIRSEHAPDDTLQ